MNKRKFIGIFMILTLSTGIYSVSYFIRDILYGETVNTNVDLAPTVVDEGLPKFTAETLLTYNGQNGQAAYIAMNGAVYDVSQLKEWQLGTHFGMVAGIDLTPFFSKSPHDLTILDRAVIVGAYENANGQSTVVSTPALKVLTMDELSQYDGKNGQASYVAVNGLIYDVSHLIEWQLGKHFGGVSAGTDLTLEFPNSPHTFNVLKTATVVGMLEGDTPKVTADMLKGIGDEDGGDEDEDDEGDDD